MRRMGTGEFRLREKFTIGTRLRGTLPPTAGSCSTLRPAQFRFSQRTESQSQSGMRLPVPSTHCAVDCSRAGHFWLRSAESRGPKNSENLIIAGHFPAEERSHPPAPDIMPELDAR